MKQLVVSLLAVGALSAPQSKQTFTGVITDDMCEKGSHAHMQMGPTNAECAVACADAHGAMYVLFDGKTVYTLSNQLTPKQYAGERVRIVGTLVAKTKTIQVDSISAAK